MTFQFALPVGADSRHVNDAMDRLHDAICKVDRREAMTLLNLSYARFMRYREMMHDHLYREKQVPFRGDDTDFACALAQIETWQIELETNR